MSNWSLTLPDLIGFIGVGLLIGAYAALQFEKLAADNPWYSGLNAIAALLITVSLLYSFNAASFVIEIFWFGISIYGLYKALRSRRSNSKGHQSGTTPEP